MKIDDINEGLIEVKKQSHGFASYLPLKITAAVKADSYLHIGAAGSPLSEKKGPVFTIQGRPAIPATSFKGAWRAQMETLLERDFDGLIKVFGVSLQDRALWMPCIPSPARGVTKAERDEFGTTRKLASCQVEIQEETLRINGPTDPRNPRSGDPAICPVCYFFGANGLPGFLRVSNLMLPPEVAESGLYDQTRIRRVRGRADGVAPGALVTLDQVEPGTKFVGEMELTLESGQLTFGKTRDLGDNKGDLWLLKQPNRPLKETRILLLKHLLIPALLNVRVLGGMRSMKAGNVDLQFDI
jgi:CRISPR/Cas system CSM-associated protein Csm3 (group 7 of RAMP superfamily)